MEVLRNIMMVVRKPAYSILAFLMSCGLFVVFIVVNNLSMFTTAFEATNDFWIMVSVFAKDVDMIASIGGVPVMASIITVSSLGGLSIALFIYKMKNTTYNAGGSLLSFSGLFGGALSSTCSACSATLISILGIAGGLSAFPFKGLEISAVSIAVLTVSIYFTAKNINGKNACGLKNKSSISTT